MRTLWAVVATVILGTTLSAHAKTTISENETGLIAGSNTTDSQGLFGPAGANLAGKVITIHLQYVPAYFGAVTPCRIASSCNRAEAQNSINTPGAVLIAITVNDRTVVYTSTHFGQVLFDKSSAHRFYIYADTTDFGLGYTGCRVRTAFNAPVTFNSTLSPTNNPNFNAPAAVDFYTPQDQLPAETLTFTLTGATD